MTLPRSMTAAFIIGLTMTASPPAQANGLAILARLASKSLQVSEEMAAHQSQSTLSPECAQIQSQAASALDKAEASISEVDTLKSQLAAADDKLAALNHCGSARQSELNEWTRRRDALQARLTETQNTQKQLQSHIYQLVDTFAQHCPDQTESSNK